MLPKTRIFNSSKGDISIFRPGETSDICLYADDVNIVAFFKYVVANIQ